MTDNGLLKMGDLASTVLNKRYAWTKGDGSKENMVELGQRVSKHVFKAVDGKKSLVDEVARLISLRIFLPGGRYLFAAGRPFHQVCNCVLQRVEDSREGWSEHLRKASMALMTGAGIGDEYSLVRSEGKPIRRTGGVATGPLSLMQMTNEVGRGIRQGGTRRCLPENALITMADYSKKAIKNIKVGDEVLTRFGAKRVTNVFDQGEQELIEVETEYGVVRSTANHKWLTANAARSKTFSVPTSKLSLDCKLYFHPAPDAKGKYLDTDYAYTLGYYLGDGCAYTSGRTAEVTFQLANRKYNKAQAARISSAMRQLGANPVIRNGHGDCTEIRCRSVELVTKFQAYKRPNMPFDIPKEIEEAHLEARYAFLAGWFDSDGYLGEDAWKVANKHSSTRTSLCMFMRRLGFVATQNGNEVRLNSYQRVLFKKTVGKYMFKRSRWQANSKDTPEIPSRIFGIKQAGKCRTYDIEVADVHEFIADDFVSHNSAIWAGLNWKHPDIMKFIHFKDWSPEVMAMKEKDYDFPAPLDGTNISVGLDDEFFKAYHDEKHRLHSLARNVYWETIRQMLRTGEPGFSINVGKYGKEILRNACTEITSADPDDICNLGSINMARIDSLDQMRHVVEVATAFLLAGSVYTDVPYSEIDAVKNRNRRLGLGLMGLHEWLLKHGKKYGADSELEEYLKVYRDVSDDAAAEYADAWELSCPIGKRAIAPNGTIGILAETTTGVEPILYVALKRLYMDGNIRRFQYVIDPCAQRLIEQGADPDMIEDAYTLAAEPERRVAFQSWVQQYIDHGISSTINLPRWGSELNNESRVREFGDMLLPYLPKLRGITVYPDGARMGQPMQAVSYRTAVKHMGKEFTLEQGDVCDLTKGGSCGL